MVVVCGLPLSGAACLLILNCGRTKDKWDKKVMNKWLLFVVSLLVVLLVFLLILDCGRTKDEWDKKVMNKRLLFVCWCGGAATFPSHSRVGI